MCFCIIFFGKIWAISLACLPCRRFRRQHRCVCSFSKVCSRLNLLCRMTVDLTFWEILSYFVCAILGSTCVFEYLHWWNFSRVISLPNLLWWMTEELTSKNLYTVLMGLPSLQELKYLKSQLATQFTMLNDCRADFWEILWSNDGATFAARADFSVAIHLQFDASGERERERERARE